MEIVDSSSESLVLSNISCPHCGLLRVNSFQAHHVETGVSQPFTVIKWKGIGEARKTHLSFILARHCITADNSAFEDSRSLVNLPADFLHIGGLLLLAVDILFL